MQIGDQIRLIKRASRMKIISDWFVKEIGKKFIILDNTRYITCLIAADFIDQSETKIYIKRNGEYEQMQIVNFYDLRKIKSYH